MNRMFLSGLVLSLGLLANPALSEERTYTLTNATSILTAGGSSSGFDFLEQSTGSLSTKYSGTIKVDQTATSIKIIEANLVADNGGNYAPGINGLEYTDLLPANYGFTLNMDFFGFGFGAARDLTLRLFSPIAISVTSGQFNTTTVKALALTGGIDFNLGDLGVAERNSLSGKLATSSGAAGTLGVNSLKLPLDLKFQYSTLSFFTLKGELNASYEAPLPTAHAPADFNGDCKIDTNDYNLWKSNFGKSPATLADGDANGNGTIDAADYTVWRNFLGNTPTGCTSPAFSSVKRSIKKLSGKSSKPSIKNYRRDLKKRINKSINKIFPGKTKIEYYLGVVANFIVKYQEEEIQSQFKE